MPQKGGEGIIESVSLALRQRYYHFVIFASVRIYSIIPQVLTLNAFSSSVHFRHLK